MSISHIAVSGYGTLLKRNNYLKPYSWVSDHNRGWSEETLSIATTVRCRGGCYAFPGLLHFTLDAYLIKLSIKQSGIKCHFLSLWYDSTRDWTPVSRKIGKTLNHTTVCKLFVLDRNTWYLLWPRKGLLMKTQTRILDNRLYYTRKIELHRKGKKSRTVWITPILTCKKSLSTNNSEKSPLWWDG